MCFKWEYLVILSLSLQKGLFPYGTVIFVITCSMFWVYLYFYLPETKGKTIEETTATFKQATATSCMGILR